MRSGRRPERPAYVSHSWTLFITSVAIFIVTYIGGLTGNVTWVCNVLGFEDQHQAMEHLFRNTGVLSLTTCIASMAPRTMHKLSARRLSRIINGVIVVHYLMEAFIFRVLRFEFVVVVMLFGIMDILHTYESYKAQVAQEGEGVVMSPSRKVY